MKGLLIQILLTATAISLSCANRPFESVSYCNANYETLKKTFNVTLVKSPDSPLTFEEIKRKVSNCGATVSCSNGHQERRRCPFDGLRGGWKFLIPLNEPFCSVTVWYDYSDYYIIGYSTTGNCSFSTPDINISFNDTMKSKSVGNRYEIQCLVNAEGVNSTIVSVSWTGPNGATITNDGRLTITPTVSNGTNHISTLQFSYLSEDDKGLYECGVETLGFGINISTNSTNLEIIVPTPNVTVTALNNQQVGDPLLLECNVTTVRGITSGVDIVWITNDTEVRRVSVSGEVVGNSMVYSDTYSNGSFLSEDDNGAIYQCSVTTNSSLPVSDSDYHVLNLTIPTPNVTVTALSNQQVGEPLSLECNVTTVRGITSSVDIVWIINDTKVRDNDVSRETLDSSVVYTALYNIPELTREHNGSVYSCIAMVNGSTSTENLMIELPPQSSNESVNTSNKEETTLDYSVAALIISAIVVATIVVITIVLLWVFIKNRKLHLHFAKENRAYTISSTTPSICDHGYYSTVGREAPSICDTIATHEKIENWLDDAQKSTDPTNITKDEMLKSIRGQRTKSSSDSGHHNNLSIPSIGSYISESDDKCTGPDSTEQPPEFENKNEHHTEDSATEIKNSEISSQQSHQFDAGYVDYSIAKLPEDKDSMNTEIKDHLLPPQTVDNETFQITSVENAEEFNLLDDKITAPHFNHNPQLVSNRVDAEDTEVASSVDSPAKTSDLDAPPPTNLPFPFGNSCSDYIPHDDGNAVFILEADRDVSLCYLSDNCTPGHAYSTAPLTHDDMEPSKTLPNGHRLIVKVQDYCRITQ